MSFWVIRAPAPYPHIRFPATGPQKTLTSLNWTQYKLKEDSTS